VKADVIAESPTVRLDLESRPETLTLVRGMLGGVAELFAIDPELLDDLKTAVSEACNNVVMHAYDGQAGPMRVRLFVTAGGIRVIVEDSGVGISSLPRSNDRLQGVGLPVIQALTDGADFKRRPGGGTEVQMAFAAKRDGRALFKRPLTAGDDDGWPGQAAGEVALSLSPVALLSSVLGRVARALAAASHFSLDRFSDVYLVTDALANHAATAASGPRIGCRLIARERRLELRVGPFRAGSGVRLRSDGPDGMISPLVLLSDEVTVERAGDDELLRLLLVDQRR
jgi:serine/threonine-protein kinase RsbW